MSEDEGTPLFSDLSSEKLSFPKDGQVSKGAGRRSGFHEQVLSRAQTTSSDVPYVSRHFTMAPGELAAYLERKGISYKTTDTHFVVENCPFCHPIKNQTDNQFKLYIKSSSGVFHCFRCSAGGSWWKFRQRIDGVTAASVQSFVQERERGFGPVSSLSPKASDISSNNGTLPRPDNKTLDEMVKLLVSSTRLGVLEYLVEKRKLTSEVILKYRLGAVLRYFRTREVPSQPSEENCVVFPTIDQDGNLLRLKIRSLVEKSNQLFLPRGGARALFGMHTVPKNSSVILITEGEFDAMAAHQETGLPCVSLPNGANSLPPEVVESLEDFETVYLWLDDDVPGQNAAQKFARKLGLRRCFNIKTRTTSGGRSGEGPKDANDALIAGMDLMALVQAATRVPHEEIITFRDLRDDVLRELENPRQVEGIGSECFPGLTQLLKGHRSGELTLFSGRTGIGKTTFLSQLSLDYAAQGVPTLWGSFEINNVRLAKALMTQFFTSRTQRPAVELVPCFDEWAELFEALPIFFLKFSGSVPVDRVLDAMEYANYVQDVSHVLLDNLQFMTSGQGRGMDRFEVMDDAIRRLRSFSTSAGAHVTLVIHPRKEARGEELSLSSIFGSAKATQEADNVVVLQHGEEDPPDIRRVEVLKNRFDGHIGKFTVVYDTNRKLYIDTTRGGSKQKRAVE